jgi:glycosyltransferase involved in cell wall biosynthesis
MTPLLEDLIARCLRDPGNAPRWHQLAGAWFDSDAADRAAMFERLAEPAAREATATPAANLLRLTFLDGLGHDADALRKAARLTLEIDPIDVDRLAGWMSFATARGLRDAATRSTFVQMLVTARVPEMAARLAHHLAGLSTAQPWLPRRVPEDIARVAIVLPYAGNAFHTPSALALDYAHVCVNLGWSVHVFSCQEMLPPDTVLYRGDGIDVLLAKLDLQHWGRSLPPGMSLSVGDPRLSVEARWRQIRENVTGFNPDLVFLVGLYSPLAAVLQPWRPTIGVNVHTIPPIAPLDVWLTSDAGLHGQRVDSFGGRFGTFEAFHHPYRLRVDASAPALPRGELGVPDDALLAITVGFRLPEEIHGELAARVVALIRARPNFHWLLLGGKGTLPPALADAPRGQVHAVAARADVPRVLRSADLFLNPARMGGGFSVAEAMACGVPVLSLAGSDGGDKVGEEASADLDAYLHRLESLLDDPAARRALGDKLRARYASVYDLDAGGPSLRQAALRALALFRERAVRPARPVA